MRLAILQDHFRNGGTERQSLFLARFCRQAGDEVTLVVFRPGGQLEAEMRAVGARVEVLQSWDSGLSLWAPGLRSRLRAIAPQVVICMGRTANCYAGWVQKWFPEVAVVSTLRTGKMVFPLHWWALGKVRAVLVNTTWWKRHLRKRGLTPDRIHVIRNSHLLDRPVSENRDLRLRVRTGEEVPDRTPVFLNVATFRSGKRQSELLAIFSELAREKPGLDWRLWLIGDGPEWKRCSRLASDPVLRQRVKLFGYQKDPFPFYCAADAAVSVSLEDSLPNFLIEAQAAALPVVAYDYRGVRECFLPGRTGVLIPTADRASMQAALMQWISRPEDLPAMGSGGPAFVRERFAPAPQAAKTRRFLQRLLNAS